MAELDVATEPIQAICINSSAVPSALQPIASGLGQLISLMSVFVGGIIGLYVLFMFLQWRERRQINKKLKHMQSDITLIKTKLGIKNHAKKKKK